MILNAASGRRVTEGGTTTYREISGAQLTIGDFEVTVLSDGTYELDGGAFFGVVPKVLWEKRVQADARNMLNVGTNSLLIRDGKQTVLIETGIGPKLSEKSQSIYKNQVRLMKISKRRGFRRTKSISSSIRTCISTTADGTPITARESGGDVSASEVLRAARRGGSTLTSSTNATG